MINLYCLTRNLLLHFKSCISIMQVLVIGFHRMIEFMLFYQCWQLTEYFPFLSVVTNPCCYSCSADFRLNCALSSSAPSGGVRYSALPCSGNSRKALSWNPVEDINMSFTKRNTWSSVAYLSGTIHVKIIQLIHKAYL